MGWAESLSLVGRVAWVESLRRAGPLLRLEEADLVGGGSDRAPRGQDLHRLDVPAVLAARKANSTELGCCVLPSLLRLWSYADAGTARAEGTVAEPEPQM